MLVEVTSTKPSRPRPTAAPPRRARRSEEPEQAEPEQGGERDADLQREHEPEALDGGIGRTDADVPGRFRDLLRAHPEDELCQPIQRRNTSEALAADLGALSQTRLAVIRWPRPPMATAAIRPASISTISSVPPVSWR